MEWMDPLRCERSSQKNPEPGATRWLQVCTDLTVETPVCERASYVVKRTNTETGQVWFTGVVWLNGVDGPPTVRAFFSEEGIGISDFSNEKILQHGSMLIAPATPVPEPGSGTMFIVGVLALGLMTWAWRGGETKS